MYFVCNGYGTKGFTMENDVVLVIFPMPTTKYKLVSHFVLLKQRGGDWPGMRCGHARTHIHHTFDSWREDYFLTFFDTCCVLMEYEKIYWWNAMFDNW